VDGDESVSDGKRKEVIEALRGASRPQSTNEVSHTAGMDWHTANEKLHKLEAEGLVRKDVWNNRLTAWSIV
jgi:predicted ArsR family transcriptional regulator